MTDRYHDSIIFRAFQGAGGGAAYSLSTVLLTELVPPEKLASATAQLTMGIPLSMLLGPIIGGAISGSPGTNWRWIFLIKYVIWSPYCVLDTNSPVFPSGPLLSGSFSPLCRMAFHTSTSQDVSITIIAVRRQHTLLGLISWDRHYCYWLLCL